MQRREASRLFREICESFPQSFIFDSVMLRQETGLNRSNCSFELQIKTTLTGGALKAVESVVTRHNLEIRECAGSFFIRSRKPQIELLA
jgi:hypothetical protein